MKQELPGICFIGCGQIAEKHAKLLKKLFQDIELSFASQKKSKAREWAERFGSKNFFSSYEEALSSDKFDIAFITTPHAYHSKLAAKAARNGRDIIIEKPAARNLKEMSNLMKAVSRFRVRCTVAENYYYKPIVKKVRRYIDNGLIGKVLFLELNKTGRDEKDGWRIDREMMGGGALLEGGVHWINAIVSLAGIMPVEVLAVKPDVKYETNIPFEDTLMLFIKFSNGTVGKLLHSWRIPNHLKGISLSKIYGTEGVITFESNGLFCSVFGKKNRISFINPTDFLGFKAMHRAFIDDYVNGKPWRPGMDRISLELKLIDSSYKSIKTGRFEKI